MYKDGRGEPKRKKKTCAIKKCTNRQMDNSFLCIINAQGQIEHDNDMPRNNAEVFSLQQDQCKTVVGLTNSRVLETLATPMAMNKKKDAPLQRLGVSLKCTATKHGKVRQRNILRIGDVIRNIRKSLLLY